MAKLLVGLFVEGALLPAAELAGAYLDLKAKNSRAPRADELQAAYLERVRNGALEALTRPMGGR